MQQPKNEQSEVNQPPLMSSAQAVPVWTSNALILRRD